MKRDLRTVLSVFFRSLRLRCPACGNSSIVKRPFHIKDACPSCKSIFKREEGFFVGAILANVVATELIIVTVYLISIPIFASRYQLVLTGLFVIAVTFPLVFYHHSWGLWLGMDHLIEGLPREERR